MTVSRLSDRKPVSSSILEKGCLALNLPRQRTSIVADYLKKDIDHVGGRRQSSS